MRLRYQSEPRDLVKRRFGLFPPDTRVFNPEVGVVAFTPVGHAVRVEELNAKVEDAHPAVLVEVPDQLVLQAFWVALLQRTCQIVRRRYCRVLDNIDRAMTKWHVAPVTQLLVRSDLLADLQFCQCQDPQHSQLVLERQR